MPIPEEEMRPGLRVRLRGFEKAYVPSRPTGTVLRKTKSSEWWEVEFDPDVKFAKPHATADLGSRRRDRYDLYEVPRPYGGFTGITLELLPPLYSCPECNVESEIPTGDYVCASCRTLMNEWQDGKDRIPAQPKSVVGS